MLKVITYGPWQPDTPQSGQPHPVTGLIPLASLKNALPTKQGYRSVPSYAAITPALAEAYAGGAAFVGSDGTASLLGATAAGLYRYSTGAWSSLLTVASSAPWHFAQFGDNVICVNGGTPVRYQLLAGTAAALTGSPPTATQIATVRDFVVLGQSAGNINQVAWSGFNDCTGWTAGTNQSGVQPLQDGGEVLGLAGGENGLILQKNALKRMSYVGVPVVFQFDTISANIGCMASGSVVQAGQNVYFLSERGFMVSDRNTVAPIGNELVDRTFFARYSRQDIASSLTAAADPRNSLILWAMPGSPGTVWAYNYELHQWATFEVPLAAIFTGFTANVSIDALDALYPGGIDTVPGSLDDPAYQGGNPLLLVVSPTWAVGSLSGPTLAATFQVPNVEPVPTRRARIRAVRPVGDATAPAVSLNARMLLNAPESLRAASGLRSNGKMPIRANGRYVGVTHTIPAGDGWTFTQGIELEFEPEGSR